MGPYSVLSSSENTKRIWPQGIFHTQQPHISSLCLTCLRHPAEECWPPWQESLVCCFWDWKGQVPSSSRKLSKRATIGGETRHGLVCRARNGGLMRRSGKQQGVGGYLGAMMDGLQSVSQSLSVINEVKVETWGRCIHKAHGTVLWNVSSDSPVVEQMLT